jgi:hypothetical protein
MSTMVAELYDALRQAGVTEPLARAAATAVLAAEVRQDLATKADLQAAVAELRSEFRTGLADTKAELIKWNVGALAVLTAIFATIVRLG